MDIVYLQKSFHSLSQNPHRQIEGVYIGLLPVDKELAGHQIL